MHVATIELADSVRRPVMQEPDRRQYVIDADGNRVYGVWYVPRDDDPQPDIVVGDELPV